MDIQYVLFNPQGRIGPRTFLRGLILLTAGYMLIQIAGWFVSPGFFVLTFPFIYMYVCVFAKRLHDAGQTAWLYLAFLVGYFVLENIARALLLPILSPEGYALNLQLQQVMIEKGMEALLEQLALVAEELARKSALAVLSSFLITSAILATVAARLSSDPHSNRYGPPPGARPTDTFS